MSSLFSQTAAIRTGWTGPRKNDRHEKIVRGRPRRPFLKTPSRQGQPSLVEIGTHFYHFSCTTVIPSPPTRPCVIHSKTPRALVGLCGWCLFFMDRAGVCFRVFPFPSSSFSYLFCSICAPIKFVGLTRLKYRRRSTLFWKIYFEFTIVDLQ